MSTRNQGHKHLQGHTFGANGSVSRSGVTEHVPAGVVQPKKFSFTKGKKIALVVGAIFLGGALSSAIEGISDNLSDGGIPAAVEDDAADSVNLLALEGETVQYANDVLEEEGIDDITVERSALPDIETDDDDLEVGLLVGSAEADGDAVIINASYHPLDVVNALEIEGLRWNEAEPVLTAAGMENGVEYVVATDTGEMYNPANWAVDYTDQDGSQARIVVTNEGLENLREGASDVTESLRDSASDIADDVREMWNEGTEGN